MRLEYLLSIWLIIISIMMILLGSQYIIKPKELENAISIGYESGKLILELNTDVKIYSLTIFPDTMTYEYSEQIFIDKCPTAVVLSTDKGYYKVFDIKC